jgi:predicted metal-dependent peptidase
MKPADDKEMLDRVHESFRRIGLTSPYLVDLIKKLHVLPDRRVETMGVFASGRLVVNPDFVRGLSSQDLMFVLTHELYHLTLRTHERSEGTDPLDFNYAHDYIINDMLREEMQHPIPAGGPDWPGARLLSAEKILGEMKRNSHDRPASSWSRFPGGGSGSGGEERPGQGPAGDVLDGDLEKKMFPQTQPGEQKNRVREVQETAAKAMSLKALMESMSGQGKGDDPAGEQNTVAALRGLYRPPWELALQRWMESVAPSDRSYARPSRRGADRTDVVLPGRKREGWTLHIVLDTSGSMVEEVPKALGAIADFCEAIGVDQVHLIQCDTEVGSDEVLAPAEMAQWQVTGYGGSNLSPAMLRLAENAEVSAAIVLTDGEIDYPETPLPYNVLWVLPPGRNLQEFTPRYGRVIAMTHH